MDYSNWMIIPSHIPRMKGFRFARKAIVKVFSRIFRFGWAVDRDRHTLEFMLSKRRVFEAA